MNKSLIKDALMLAITYTPSYQKSTKNDTRGPVYGFVSDGWINLKFTSVWLVYPCVFRRSRDKYRWSKLGSYGKSSWEPKPRIISLQIMNYRSRHEPMTLLCLFSAHPSRFDCVTSRNVHNIGLSSKRSQRKTDILPCTIHLVPSWVTQHQKVCVSSWKTSSKFHI